MEESTIIIENYVESLIKNMNYISLEDFLKGISKLINFVDYKEYNEYLDFYIFLKTSNRNEFNININKLYKYNIIEETEPNEIVLYVLNDIFKLKENQDYKLLNNEYKLTPQGFEICLLNSLEPYAFHDIELHSIFDLWNESYQYVCNQQMIKMLDKKIQTIKKYKDKLLKN
jgi:hypothetical protein